MRTIAILAVLAGCNKGKEKLDSGPYCEETPTVVAIDEVTALGFSAQGLLDLAQGTHDETFTWLRDDSTTPLTLIVTHGGGEARFIDSEAVYPEGTATAMGVICDDRVEVDVDVDFTTEDGAFDESWALALGGIAPEAATFRQELDPDGLGGSYDMDDDISETYDERRLWAAGTFDAEGSRGEISGQISGAGDCDDGETCTAWAGAVSVGTWGVQER